MFDKYNTILTKTLLFKGIDTNEFIPLLNCFKPKISEYEKNEYIAVAGEKLEYIGILIKGEAAVVKEDAMGSRVIMTLLKPGDMFGEMVVFSSKSVWPASVIAQEPSGVIFLSCKKIVGECEKLCPWHRTIIQNLLTIISERALMLNRKVEYLTIKSMRGRICAFLLEQYKKIGKTTFMLPMKRNELADFLNVSRPSMSREMSRMKEEGIIDFHLASIRIIDMERLKRMTE